MTTDPQPGSAVPAPRRARDNALDALRLIAVLFMIASHTSRLIAWDARRDWSRFSLLVEPMTASLFLTLVGASLAHSWLSARARAQPGSARAQPGKGRGDWMKRQAARALALWAVSCVFYSLEDGPHFPDVVTMSGILATIAYTILIGMAWVSASRPVPFLAVLAAAMAGLHVWLDVHGMKVFVLNAGNSPLLPLTLFACLGALGAFALESGSRAARLGLVAAALVSVELILRRHGFTEVFSKPLGRYETVRTIVMAQGEARIEKDIPYYNLRPILVPMIAGLTVLLYAVLALARPALDRCSRHLLSLGRRSLDVYILHLSLLAILVVAGGKRPLKASWQGDAVFLGVIAICWLWVTARDRYPRFPKFWVKTRT
jgi:acyltransferase-like protein